MDRGHAHAWVCVGVVLLGLCSCGRVGYHPRLEGEDGATIGEGGVAPVIDGAVDGGSRDAAPPTETLTVAPTYPAHAAWNDYVARTDPAADASHQPDVACAALDPIDGSVCIHGGERRTVETTRASCAGLSLADDRGALLWRCDDRSGRAIFYSHALAPGRGLGDLITATGWRPMQVTLFEGATAIETSPRAAWWSNRIVPLPSGGGTLTNASADIGDVFVAATDQSVGGIVLGSDRIALVVLPGATITFDPAVAPGCSSAAGGAVDAHCIVYGQDRSFLWIEGAFRGSRALADLRGILLRQTRSSCLRRVRVASTGASGLELQSIFESRIEDIEQESSGGSGLRLDVAAHNRIARVRLADVAGEAFSLGGIYAETDAALTGSYNWVHDLNVTNSAPRSGITLACGTHDNVLTRVVASSNESRGVFSVCNSRTTMSHLTATANGGPGIDIDQVDTAVVVQAIAAGNQIGLEVDYGAGPGRFAQIVATDNAGAGVRLDATNGVFSGALVVGSNGGSDCAVEGRSSPGLIHGTCTVSGADGSSDYGAETSTAMLRTGRTLASTFVGRITVDDPVNGSDVAGAAAMPTDWTRFTSVDRGWGRDGDVLGDAATRGRCTSSCRIWDWGLAATDTQITGRSGDGATVSLPMLDAACPAWVRGDVAITDWVRLEILGDGTGNDDGACQGGEACGAPNTFLVNALEIVGDDLGDEDGLCESDETCVASPHFGASQGNGDPTGTCTFDPGPGPITGVTMRVR